MEMMVNIVTSFSVWLGENKATPPLEEAETAGRASPQQITLGAEKAIGAGNQRPRFVLFPQGR